MITKYSTDEEEKVLRQIVFAHKRSNDLYFSLTICLEIPRAVTDSRRSCAVAIVDSNRRGELARKENNKTGKLTKEIKSQKTSETIKRKWTKENSKHTKENSKRRGELARKGNK